MTERKTLVSLLLIVIVALVAGYVLGQFSAPAGETVTTTTSSTTITEIQTITEITETATSTTIIASTTTIVRDLPSTIPSPANSTAIIRGHYFFNGAVFMTFSIDKPTYSIGETVHMKSTITNLTPNNMSFLIGSSEAMINVLNSTMAGVWGYPEFLYAFYAWPLPMVQLDVAAGETKTIPWMTADWNMKGLHQSGGNVTDYYIPWNNTGLSLKGDFYNDQFVSEGQYTVEWPVGIIHLASERWPREYSRETIPITITKQN